MSSGDKLIVCLISMVYIDETITFVLSLWLMAMRPYICLVAMSHGDKTINFVSSPWLMATRPGTCDFLPLHKSLKGGSGSLVKSLKLNWFGNFKAPYAYVGLGEQEKHYVGDQNWKMSVFTVGLHPLYFGISAPPPYRVSSSCSFFNFDLPQSVFLGPLGLNIHMEP